jgi:hypothetical protein
VILLQNPGVNLLTLTNLEAPMKASLTFAAALVLVGIHFATTTASAQSTSFNSGSLGSLGNGTNSATVTLGLPSPIFAGNGTALGYTDDLVGANTIVPFRPALNPLANQPFTIEFWARPTESDNDSAAVSNRLAGAAPNRAGWVFFQRDAATGWNFKMYNGSGSAMGWDITGGTATLNAWSHVVATWNGTTALLYVNGSAITASSTGSGLNGVYNPNTATDSPNFAVGTNSEGTSGFTGSLDEVAFYGSTLTPLQIANHFALAQSPVVNAYSSAVIGDGAVEYLQNVPEPASVGLMLAGVGLIAGRRQRRRA